LLLINNPGIMWVYQVTKYGSRRRRIVVNTNLRCLQYYDTWSVVKQVTKPRSGVWP